LIGVFCFVIPNKNRAGDAIIIAAMVATRHIVLIFEVIKTLNIIGAFGNVMVIYVYNWRFKRRSANFFISAMAIFDLLGCLISMPAGVYDLIHS
jgi:hypothetical protein